MTTITLDWIGPYDFGHFHKLEEYQQANEPHVYVRIETFQLRKIVAVGKATNLADRMDQHLRAFLGRQYYLSDESKAHKYKPGNLEGLKIYDAIDEWLHIAVDEVKKFSFFAAPCERKKLDYVEAELISKFLDIAKKSNEFLVPDNWKREGKSPEEIILEHNFSRSPSARGVLEYVSDTYAPR